MLASARRTHTCGELRAEHAGAQVVIQGWVHSYRHLGGIQFLVIRDRFGLVQVTLDERCDAALHDDARRWRQEYVVEVEGTVALRSAPNKKMSTGIIEVVPTAVRLHAATPPLPFSVDSAENAHEETRLRYRYLDLRRPHLQNHLVIRHRAAQSARRYLDGEDFIEIETPVLTRATPEGARDYLVPSRVHPGQWYALPQSPQIFKQIRMIAGMDRYFQIVKCFRDEDLRADRQPEFTQIDIEMSFATQAMAIELGNGVLRAMWRDVLGIEIGEIPLITYTEAMRRYGVDNPDCRFGLEHSVVTDLLSGSASSVVQGGLADGGIAKAMILKGRAATCSRKVIDGWTKFVRNYGMGGLLWGKVAVSPEGGLGWSGPAKKLLSDEERAAVSERLGGAEAGDIVLLGLGPASKVNAGLGRLRGKLGRDFELCQPGDFAFRWVVDFPAFDYDEDEDRWVACHHPFTKPKDEHVDLLGTERAGEILSDAYDLVCNGYEIAGGSIRIHDSDVQSRVFRLLGIGEEEARIKFGFLLDALSYGAPPHGGIAFGLDRLVMHIVGTDNIRDVIAFPKTQSGGDLMIDAPSAIDDAQLVELNVRSTVPAPTA